MLRGNTVVIGAELVDVAEGTQLWGEQYNSRVRGILAVQAEIADEIKRGLRVKLTPENEAPLARRHSGDSEVYRLCLLSRHHRYNGRLQKALDYARKAIEKGPTYAPAYVALARAYTSLGNAGQLSNREANSEARLAAKRALELDESLPEAHSVLARVQWVLDWDWVGAEREFRRAIELNPSSEDAHSDYAIYLCLIGRWETALVHVRSALELDPLTSLHRERIGWVYYMGRQYDRALEALREAQEFAPNLGFHFRFGWVYREKGMYDRAIAEFLETLSNNPGHPHTPGHLGNAYARAG